MEKYPRVLLKKKKKEKWSERCVVAGHEDGRDHKPRRWAPDETVKGNKQTRASPGTSRRKRSPTDTDLLQEGPCRTADLKAWVHCALLSHQVCDRKLTQTLRIFHVNFWDTEHVYVHVRSVKAHLHKARRALLSWQGEVQVKRRREVQGAQLLSSRSFSF